MALFETLNSKELTRASTKEKERFNALTKMVAEIIYHGDKENPQIQEMIHQLQIIDQDAASLNGVYGKEIFKLVDHPEGYQILRIVMTAKEFDKLPKAKREVLINIIMTYSNKLDDLINDWFADTQEEVIVMNENEKNEDMVEANPESKDVPKLSKYTAKADKGKLPITYVPTQIIRDIARVRQYGDEKYHSPSNWVVVDKNRYKDALMRHLLAYLDDEKSIDKESKLTHLAHAATNIAFLCEMERPDWEEQKQRIINRDPEFKKRLEESDLS